MSGWLVGQLPQVMVDDPLTRDLVTAFEQVADGVRDRIEGVESQLDVSLASPPMLRFLASWLDVALDPGGEDELQRELVRSLGGLLGWRGTAKGVEELLSAATGSRVEVLDGGGVFGAREPLPPRDDRVRVTVEHLGSLTRGQLVAYLGAELPLGCVVDLEVRYE